MKGPDLFDPTTQIDLARAELIAMLPEPNARRLQSSSKTHLSVAASAQVRQRSDPPANVIDLAAYRRRRGLEVGAAITRGSLATPDISTIVAALRTEMAEAVQEGMRSPGVILGRKL
jgi:hypothetical protein